MTDKYEKYYLKPKKVKMSEDLAMPQVMKLLERYDIDLKVMDEKDQEANSKMIDNILKSIMNGKLEVIEKDGQIKVKQTLEILSPDTSVEKGFIIYNELEGKHQTNMPVGESTSQFAQIDYLMGQMCDQIDGPEVVTKLKSSDRKTMQYLGLLFLAQ